MNAPLRVVITKRFERAALLRKRHIKITDIAQFTNIAFKYSNKI